MSNWEEKWADLMESLNNEEEILTEGCDKKCPECGELLGKAKELPKTLNCGNCGKEDIKNPDGCDEDDDIL